MRSFVNQRRGVVEVAELKFEFACGELVGGGAATARKWVAQALAAATRHQASALRAAALGMMAVASTFREDVPAAAVHLRSAEALLDSLLDDELAKRLDAAVWVGMVEIFFDSSTDALRHLDRALRLARSTGQGMILLYLLANRVLALCTTGRLIDASACAGDAAGLALLMGSNEHPLARLAATERRRLAAYAACSKVSTSGTGLGTLTGREKQVAHLVAEGQANRQIARQLRVTEKTVEMYLSKILPSSGLPRAPPWQAPSPRPSPDPPD